MLMGCQGRIFLFMRFALYFSVNDSSCGLFQVAGVAAATRDGGSDRAVWCNSCVENDDAVANYYC